MPYELSYDADTGILTATVSGTLDKSLIEPLSVEMRELTVKHDCKLFLNDMRQAWFELSITDVFGLPQLMEALGTDPSSRHAIVVTGESQTTRFFETVAKNRGRFVKVFTDMDQARAWLLS